MPRMRAVCSDRDDLEISAVERALRDLAHVRLAYVLGSVARGTAGPSSDIDVAVLLDHGSDGEHLDAVREAIERVCRREVDLIDLRSAPPLLRREVLREGVLVVSRDERERGRFEMQALAEYLDTQHLRDIQHHYLRERARRSVPVEPDVARKKLLQIDQAIGRLRSWLPVSRERLEQDLQLQWAVERGLHLAAEALFDAGSHVLAGEFREAVDRFGDVPPRLAAHGVISAETAARLRSLAGFRNVLVHEYADVDLARVHAGLERLDDFEAFVADVSRWLDAPRK